jgi:adenosine deaminase CECR1
MVYFQTIREETWKSLSSCCRGEYKPFSGLNEEETAAWLSSVKLDRPGEGRNEFFEVIWHRMGVLFSDPHINPELLVKNMQLFGEEGLRYLEFQLPPRGWRDGDGGRIPSEEVYEILKRRLNQEDALATGVTVRFRNVAIRYLANAEDQIEEAYAFVDAHRDLWVGIDMAGREDDDKGHPLRFLETFRKMRRRYGNIGLSIHGGEVDEPNFHVRDTLLLGATRIGHGLNLISDPETMLYMRDRDYLIETCLVSNRVLEYFPNLDEHPFPEYLRMGIPVCLNTDDRGMWDSNMTDEYFSAVKHYNLRWSEIVKMGRDSLNYSFVDDAKKEALIAAYDRDIASFEEKYQKADWEKLTAQAKPKISPYALKTFGIAH